VPIIHTATPDSIAAAAEHLRRGELVAMPTETVYGLAGAALDPRAVERIFALKGRPPDNPLIVHVRSIEEARSLTSGWDSRAEALGQRFWPGPLTLVLPAVASIPRTVTAGRSTVALRVPGHPAALALLDAFGAPLAAPSANRSGRISPTTAAHVAEEFAESDLLILDGGACSVGIESTVLELATPPAEGSATAALRRLLRPGVISPEAIEALVGTVTRVAASSQEASPGTRWTHYAPRAPARLLPRAALRRLGRESLAERVLILIGPQGATSQQESSLREGGPGRSLSGSQSPSFSSSLRTVIMPRHASSYATMLYGALREADSVQPREILIEEPPLAGEPAERGLWMAIDDRLRRACAAATAQDSA
jgi:L-threonylcarbamoyladenylate synthase